MSDTIRELIILDFLSRASGITKANGYKTDIGTHVERCRHIPPSPSVNIWPRPETSSKVYGIQKSVMPITIEGNAAYGSTNSSALAEQILGDLKRAFTDPAWARSPNYIDAIDYVGGGTENYPDEEDHVTGASALFHVSYSTVIGDPYTQGG